MTDNVDPVALVMVGLGGTIIEIDGQPVNITAPTAILSDTAVEGAPSTAPDPFAVSKKDRLRGEFIRAIIDDANGSARSLQRAIGPSEVGHPCKRHLMYKIMEVPPVSRGGDVLPGQMGTWGHAGLGAIFGGPQYAGRWIIEQELVAWDGPGGRGHGDAYDTLTNTVIDWKFKGTEGMRDIRKGIVSEQYRAQLQVYGLGWENLGYPVEDVCDVFIPRGGLLEGRYGLELYMEPYDREKALSYRERLLDLETAAVILKLDTSPAGWEHVPATPTDCHFCPWRQPGAFDLSVACPGDTAIATEKENAA